MQTQSLFEEYVSVPYIFCFTTDEFSLLTYSAAIITLIYNDEKITFELT